MSDESISNPYPGLRTFEAAESHLFFGREQQADELFKRLGQQRFVAVVGASGSGKSSVVRAGLLPLIHGGFLTTSGGSPQIACFKPGNRPVGRLAASLAEIAGFAPATQDPPTRQAWIEATLRRSGLGLVEAVKLARRPRGEALVVIVDQFEELFRNWTEEGSVFVRLLLEAVHQTDLLIFVVITMRSDYLGDCARFRDLPEALNDAQYLVPRMTRQQLRRAIECPARVAQGEIAPGLVNRLLNDVGDDSNQLPILQHALMRTWEEAQPDAEGSRLVTVEDYNDAGGMSAALRNHANGTYDALPSPRHQQIAALVFKSLTEIDRTHAEIRRQTTVGELLKITGASEQELTEVLEAFLAPGRSFLTRSPTDGPLTESVEIDISHESLIRNWSRLREWAKEEAESAERYRRLAEYTALYILGEEGLLQNPQLELALSWLHTRKPNAAWAARYGGDFSATVRFITDSDAAHTRALALKEQERQLAAVKDEEDRRLKLQRQWLRVAASASGIAIVVLGLLAWGAYRGWRSSRHQTATGLFAAALTTADRGDLVRSAHTLARAGKDPEFQSLAAQGVWPYVKALPSDLVLSAAGAGSNGARQPVRIAGLRHARADGAPEGTTIAWTESGDLYLWQRDTAPRDAAPAQHPRVTHAAFSRDGGRLVTWSTHDGSVRVWQTRTGFAPARAAKHPGLTGASFSADGENVITWGPGAARVWSVQGGRDATLPYVGETDCDSESEVRLSCGAVDPESRSAITWSKPSVKARALEAIVSYGSSEGPQAGNSGFVRFWDLSGSVPRVRATVAGVSGASFSPRGTHVVIWSNEVSRSSEPGKEQSRWNVQLWNVRSGKVEATVDDLVAPINGATFDPTGRLVAVLSSEGLPAIWDTTTPAAVMKVRYTRSFQQAIFLSPERLLTWESEAVKIWRLPAADPRATEVRELTAPAITIEHSGSNSMALSPDRAALATWGADGPVRIWKIDGGRSLGDYAKAGPLRRVEFGPLNRTLLMTGEDGRVRLWNVPARIPELDVSLSRICARPRDAKTGAQASSLACGFEASLLDDYTIVAWAVPGPQAMPGPDAPRVDFQTSQLVAIAPNLAPIAPNLREFFPDASGVRALTIGDNGALGAQASQWQDLCTTGVFRVVKVSPDGRYAFTWAYPGPGETAPSALVWDLERLESVKLEQPGEVGGATFSSDGRWLVTWTSEDVRLWNPPAVKPVRIIPAENLTKTERSTKEIGGALLTKDGALLVWRRDGAIMQLPSLDTPNGELRSSQLEMRPAGVEASADGRLIAAWTAAETQSTGVTCEVFERSSWRRVGRTLPLDRVVRRVAFAGPDRLLTITDRAAVHLWSISAGQRVADIDHDGAIRDVVTAPKTGLILTWSLDGVARLWDDTSGLPVGRTMRHQAAILSGQFTQDEEAVITYGADGWRHRWDIAADRQFPGLDWLVQVSTGTRLDVDTPVPLTTQEWTEARQQLRNAIEHHRDGGGCPANCPSLALLAQLDGQPSPSAPPAPTASVRRQ